MAMNNQLYPVDRLLSGYNLAMAGIWSMAWSIWSWAPVLVAAHAAAACLPALLRRTTEHSRPFRPFRQLYPMFWMPAFWAEVDFVRRCLHSGGHDAFVLKLEAALLHVHPHMLWMPHMHQIWLSEILYGSYLVYLLALVVPVLWLTVRARTDDLMTALFRMMAVFGFCFLFFAVFPVDGPQHTGAVFEGPNQHAFLARLVTLVARGNGESLGAAFPSSHVAGAVTVAWIARSYLPRWAFYVLAAEATGVFLSTFYTQQHYAIDAIFGAALALAVQRFAVPALLSALQERPEGVPGIPALPPPLPATLLGREVRP
ncbi:MAG: phosphatase PAP2 family protein [Gemmatimonadota bacterium]